MNSSGVYRPHTKICALLACLAQPTYPIPARCGTDAAGRGVFEPPSEDGARTKLFDREFQFRESHTEAETDKKLLTESSTKRMITHIYIYIIYKAQTAPSLAAFAMCIYQTGNSSVTAELVFLGGGISTDSGGCTRCRWV